MALDLHDLDQAFPTLVRYCGLITTLILIGFCLAGYAIQAAPGFAAAAGMILYKTVHDAAKAIDDEEDEETAMNDRWSHLP